MLNHIASEAWRRHDLHPPIFTRRLVHIRLPPVALGLQYRSDNVVQHLQESLAFIRVSNVGRGVIDGDGSGRMGRLATRPDVTRCELDEVYMG